MVNWEAPLAVFTCKVNRKKNHRNKIADEGNASNDKPRATAETWTQRTVRQPNDFHNLNTFFIFRIFFFLKIIWGLFKGKTAHLNKKLTAIHLNLIAIHFLKN